MWGESTFLRSVALQGKPVEEDEGFAGIFEREIIEVAVDKSFKSLITFQNISGKENLDSLRKEALKGADGVLCLFSLLDALSLTSVSKTWIPEVRQTLRADVPIVLIGTKSDARKKRDVYPGETERVKSFSSYLLSFEV